MSARGIGAMRRHFAVEAPVARADGVLVNELRFLAWGAIEIAASGVTIRLRQRSDIEPGWRLRLGERVFEVIAIAGDETASGFMVCTCREFSL
jgi:head-tail adaptor